MFKFWGDGSELSKQLVQATAVIITVLALIVVAGILHIKNKDLRER